MNTIVPGTNPRAATASRTSLSTISIAALAGVVIVFFAGIAQSDALHDAAHDVRHAVGFPCH